MSKSITITITPMISAILANTARNAEYVRAGYPTIRLVLPEVRVFIAAIRKAIAALAENLALETSVDFRNCDIRSNFWTCLITTPCAWRRAGHAAKQP